MASSGGASSSISTDDSRLYTAKEVIGLLERQEILQAELLHDLNCNEESESDEVARGNFTAGDGVEGLVYNNIISMIQFDIPFGFDSEDAPPSHRDSLLDEKHVEEHDEHDFREPGNEGKLIILPLHL